MKVLITSLDTVHGINPIVQRLFDPLREYESSSIDECQAVFLSVVQPPCDFHVDKALLNALAVKKVPVVIFDHVETMGPNWFLGKSPMGILNEYYRLHEIVKELDIRAYFKRELLTGFNPPWSCPVYPVDWTVLDHPQFQNPCSEEEYNARPIDLLMSWGYSSESRPRFYGELMRKAGKFGWHFALTAEDVDRSLDEKRPQQLLAALHTPHYRRIPIERICAWQEKTKLTVSLKGAGLKCFRCAEASVNSLLVQQADNSVHWAYPWIAGENCIGLPNTPEGEVDEVHALEIIYDYLRIRQGSLYGLYLKSIANQRNYISHHYSRNYLLPKLISAIGQ